MPMINSIPTKQEIQNLKNFASLDKSFKEWLTTCPREYIWQIDDVTKDHQGTFTFKKTEPIEFDLELIL